MNGKSAHPQPGMPELWMAGIETADSNGKTDESKFAETLKRMLETPPKPYEKTAKQKQLQTIAIKCGHRSDMLTTRVIYISW